MAFQRLHLGKKSGAYTSVTLPELSHRMPVQPVQGVEAADHPWKELELLTVAKLVMFPLNCNSAEAAKAMSSCQLSGSRPETSARNCTRCQKRE